MLRHILMPPYLKEGIKPLSTGFPKKVRLIVFDTETIAGKPYTIQLFDGETAQLSYHKREPILETFTKYVRKRIDKRYTTIIYAHNLDFDFPILLNDRHADFCTNKFSADYPALGVNFEICSGKMTFGKLYCPEGMAYVYDTFRFVMCSLAQAVKDLKLSHAKLPRPPYLGEREPTAEERKEFERYAMADVYAEYELGLWILSRCEELDVPIPISIAHLASLVFRKRFLEKGTKISFPPLACAVDSILSYHGGKNGLYTPVPTLLRGIHSYDINSAYPWAMKTLPNFVGGTYRNVKKFVENRVGIYTISGDYDYETYPLFYNHDFTIREPGPVRDLCVTSEELALALEKKIFLPTRISGWVYDPPTVGGDSPLAGYVDFFYAQKKKLKPSDTAYWIAKYLLNSLYGKFIQTNDYGAEKRIVTRVKEGERIFEEAQFQAGGLFQPFLASLITGKVRARLYEYETDYSAIHSSTDSILTREEATTSTDLGGLKHENTGDCLLLRNKLYLHVAQGGRWEDYTRNHISDKTSSPHQNGTTHCQNLASTLYKAALHGFQGSAEDLIRMWNARSTTYSVSRMVRLKESFEHKNLALTPFTWRQEEKTLNIDWSTYTEEP